MSSIGQATRAARLVISSRIGGSRAKQKKEKKKISSGARNRTRPRLALDHRNDRDQQSIEDYRSELGGLFVLFTSHATTGKFTLPM